MEHTKLVSPGELEDFANRRDSEPVIPELISQLVRLSCPDLTLCRIPYDDAIGLPGLDGIVKTEGGFRQFVPKQTSFWEMGRNEGAQGKATADYRKRTEKTPVEERADTTFVFVTPRSKDWDQARQSKWLKKRQNDGWKELRILDGVQLCDWLREFPAVGGWLLQRIGLLKSLTGFRTPTEHWSNLERLSGKDDPPLPAKIFLIGREEACQKLERLFQHADQQLVLATESEHDTEDFVAAFIQSLDQDKRRLYSSRCLFVSEPDAWHTFANLQVPHVLIASPRLDLTESREQLHMTARARGHGVVVPLVGAASRGADEVIPILSPSRTPLETTLVESGFTGERAGELARVGAQSLGALKRFLLGLGQRPPYATWDSARLLAQAALIGGWKGDHAPDREAMEALLGKSYGEWIEAVRGETLRPDTPLFQRNETWRVISRVEAWSALGPRLADADLDRLQQMALRVLGEQDPQFELSKEERQTGYIQPHAPSYSPTIRAALADSLALLGTRPNALSSASHGKAEATAKVVVRKLLQEADWKRWASLNDEMPVLAEAAPDQFLDAVEAALVDPASSLFVQLFRQEGSGFAGRSYLTGLLWALETLAWHPDYLGRVTGLLGDLASIDPGGNWSNRPRNSLVDIFLPWHRQTLADLSQRRAALEALLRDHPDVGWSLLLSLLPSSHGATTGTRKPAWRAIIPRTWKATITMAEYWEQVQQYAQMCIQVAASDLKKLAVLIDRLGSLPEPAHSQVLAHLTSPQVTSLPEADRQPLWEALKDLTSKHRRFAGAQWALPAERVAAIEDVAGRLAPTSFELSQLRLFTDRDWDLYEDGDDFTIQQQKLDATRQSAIRAILEAEGPEGVVRFALKAEAPHKVGETLGAIESPEVDAFLLPSHLQSNDKATTLLVDGFIWRRFWTQQYAWVDRQLELSWPPELKLAFLLKVPSERGVWQRVDQTLGDKQGDYWKQVRVNPWPFEEADLVEAAERLTAHGQPAAALDCLYLLSQKKARIAMSLASSVLLGVVSSADQLKRIEQHHLTELIKWLQENESADSEQLFLIEWAYLPLLNRLNEGHPKVLEQRLASSPAFFCEVIASIFRSDKDNDLDKKTPTEQETRIAQNAYSLLHGWRILPGTTSDGSFDGRKFVAWLDEVKIRTKQSGHFKIAMDQLGQVLAYAPEDPDGLWIHRSIAEALDSRDVPEMRRAFTVGLFNKRGVHGFSKGAEEKQIAASYREKARAVSDVGLHRLADSVRGLAKEYEQDAQSESGREIFDEP
jgi:hypothetical protein